MSALTNVYTWIKILCLTDWQGGNMSIPISSAILEVPQLWPAVPSRQHLDSGNGCWFKWVLKHNRPGTMSSAVTPHPAGFQRSTACYPCLPWILLRTMKLPSHLKVHGVAVCRTQMEVKLKQCPRKYLGFISLHSTSYCFQHKPVTWCWHLSSFPSLYWSMFCTFLQIVR
jgi:hypothetical protein